MKLTLRILFCAALLPLIILGMTVVAFIGVSFIDWSLHWSFLDLSIWNPNSRLELLLLSICGWFFAAIFIVLRWAE